MTPEERKQRFIGLYSPIHAQFERFCKARAFGEMEFGDLMNETVLLVLEKLDSLKDDKAFLSFLFTVATRVLSSSNRKMRPLRLKEGEDAMSRQSPTDSGVDVSILYDAMRELPEVQRECLMLFEISGFSIQEIMEIQGAGESAVKQRLRRARLDLAKRLNEPVAQ